MRSLGDQRAGLNMCESVSHEVTYESRRLVMIEPTISVCIPTHARPGMLAEALESVMNQSRLPSEVVVSDDAGDEVTASVVAHFAALNKAPVRHVRCLDGASQASNVNCAFRAATSDLIVLVHDDDLLCPGALEALVQPFLKVPGLVASYGQQIVVTHEGQELKRESEALNRAYGRDVLDGGVKTNSLRAAILQQFPNDGYMIRASVAKAVSYDSHFGSAVDAAFGISCALHGPFYFLPIPTAKYRLSAQSVGRGAGRKVDDAGYQFVRFCLELRDSCPAYRPELESRVRERIAVGIMQAVNSGQLDEAFSWLLSPYHRRQLLTFRGAARALYVAQACLRIRGDAHRSRSSNTVLPNGNGRESGPG
jgi:glycosyltransferase involved in cell wall biosynthesis